MNWKHGLGISGTVFNGTQAEKSTKYGPNWLGISKTGLGFKKCPSILLLKFYMGHVVSSCNIGYLDI